MRFLVSNKIAFPFTSVVTFATCEWFSWTVYHHVSSQVASSCESLAAYLTEEFPEVVSVVDVTDHDKGENPYYESR